MKRNIQFGKKMSSFSLNPSL